MVRQDNRLRQQEQEQAAESEGRRIALELKEEDGRALVKHIRETLTRRIDDLIAGDPEAKAYVKLLKELGIKIAFGRMSAERIIARELKEVSDGKR